MLMGVRSPAQVMRGDCVALVAQMMNGQGPSWA